MCPYSGKDLPCIMDMLGCLVVVVLVGVLTCILSTVVRLLIPSFPYLAHLASVRLPASVLLPGKSSCIRYNLVRSYQVTRYRALLLCAHCCTTLVDELRTVLLWVHCCSIPGCLVLCIPAGCYCRSPRGCARCGATT